MTTIMKLSVPMYLDPRKFKDHEKRLRGGDSGREAGARSAFYDDRRRRKPSLPRLKFLGDE